MPLKNCENCKRLIGELEESFIWQDHTVCSECNSRLSNQSKNSNSMEFPEVQTIEATGKKWKGAMLIGMSVMLLGLVLLLTTGVNIFSILVALVGILMTLAARLGAWWYHG